MIGICHEIQDLELKPLLINSPEIKAQDTCSPDETKTSYSDAEKFSLIFFDKLIKLFVTPLIAEETTITLYFLLKLEIIFETFLILSVVPTEVPPNLRTIIFIDNIFLFKLKYIDKIHLDCNVNKQ